jgi:hypothetical protein
MRKNEYNYIDEMNFLRQEHPDRRGHKQWLTLMEGKGFRVIANTGTRLGASPNKTVPLQPERAFFYSNRCKTG